MENQIYNNLEIIQNRINELKYMIETNRDMVKRGMVSAYNPNHLRETKGLEHLLGINVAFLYSLEKEYGVSISAQ